MRNVLGLILTLGGTWLLWSGWAWRAKALASPGGDPAATSVSLADFGAIVRPLVYIALGYLALKASLAYALLDAGRFVSPFDLAGLLYLLAAYGIWLHLRTGRPAANEAAAADLAAEMPSRRPMLDGRGSDHSCGALPGARDRAGARGVAAPAAPAGAAARRDSRAA
jgi:hypothetical protein